MESERQKPWLLALSTSFAALVMGVAGWLPLVLSAGLAMGDAPNVEIAIALGVAGAAATIATSLGGLVLLKGRRAAAHATALAAVSVGGVLGVVVLVFALSFHW